MAWFNYQTFIRVITTRWSGAGKKHLKLRNCAWRRGRRKWVVGAGSSGTVNNIPGSFLGWELVGYFMHSTCCAVSCQSPKKPNPRPRSDISSLCSQQVMTPDVGRQQNLSRCSADCLLCTDCIRLPDCVWALAATREGFMHNESRTQRGRALQPRCIYAPLMISYHWWHACMRTEEESDSGITLFFVA